MVRTPSPSTCTRSFEWRGLKRVLGLACVLLSLASTLLPTLVSGQTSDSSEPKPFSAEWTQTPEAILEAFRQQHLSDDCSFHFSLKSTTKAASSLYYGTSWITHFEGKPWIRMLLHPADALHASCSRQYIIEGGGQTTIWDISQQGASLRMPLAEWPKPLLPGISCCLFDLAMPFIYWQEWRYEGMSKLKGRRTHEFTLYPDASVQDSLPAGLVAVRISIDSKSNALIKAVGLGSNGKPVRAFQIRSLKKVKNNWFVKSIDFIDSRSHCTTRFTLLNVALGQRLPKSFFNSESAYLSRESIASDAYTAL